MHVSPAKHTKMWLSKTCDYRTYRITSEKVIRMCHFALPATQTLPFHKYICLIKKNWKLTISLSIFASSGIKWFVGSLLYDKKKTNHKIIYTLLKKKIKLVIAIIVLLQQRTTNMAAFLGMHVSPAIHTDVWLPRKRGYQTSVTTERQTNGRTDRRQRKWSLCTICFAVNINMTFIRKYV